MRPLARLFAEMGPQQEAAVIIQSHGRDAYAAHQWAEGEREVGSTEGEQRLRPAAHVTPLISETFDARTAQAWMQGMDPMLDDRSLAWVLRHATDETERAAVLASARRFVVQ